MKVDYDSKGDRRIIYEAPGVGEPQHGRKIYYFRNLILF
jgi:hypothetical protein